MSRYGIPKRGKHGSAYVRNFFLEVVDQPFDARSFEIWLRAAQVTGNDRKRCGCRKLSNIFFSAVSQRPDNRVSSIVRSQHWRHRFQRADKKEVQKKRGNDVVGMMPQSDLGTPFLYRNVIENPAPQP